jgi:hypothetical protein
MTAAHNLAWLLGPVGVEPFFERDILHLTDREPDFYDPVFAFRDLERILHQSPDFVADHLRYSRVEEPLRFNHLSAHPEIPTPIAPDSLAASVQAAFRVGYSLVVEEIAGAW